MSYPTGIITLQSEEISQSTLAMAKVRPDGERKSKRWVDGALDTRWRGVKVPLSPTRVWGAPWERRRRGRGEAGQGPVLPVAASRSVVAKDLSSNLIDFDSPRNLCSHTYSKTKLTAATSSLQVILAQRILNHYIFRLHREQKSSPQPIQVNIKISQFFCMRKRNNHENGEFNIFGWQNMESKIFKRQVGDIKAFHEKTSDTD